MFAAKGDKIGAALVRGSGLNGRVACSLENLQDFASDRIDGERLLEKRSVRSQGSKSPEDIFKETGVYREAIQELPNRLGFLGEIILRPHGWIDFEANVRRERLI